LSPSYASGYLYISLLLPCCVIPKLLPLEPNRGRGLRPLPQFEVPPDPTPNWFVRELTYAVTHGDDTPGEGGIPPPEPPPLFSVILGEARYLLPPTPTSLSPKIRRISSKQGEKCSHP